jgi:hypothetical protein
MIAFLVLFYIVGFMISWVVFIANCVDENKEPGTKELVYSFIWPLILMYISVRVILDMVGILKIR